MDNFDECSILYHIYEIYKEKDVPTLRKLPSSLQDTGLFSCSLPSLSTEIGFQYKKKRYSAYSILKGKTVTNLPCKKPARMKVFQPKKTEDYHEDMNVVVFEK